MRDVVFPPRGERAELSGEERAAVVREVRRRAVETQIVDRLESRIRNVELAIWGLLTFAGLLGIGLLLVADEVLKLTVGVR